MSRGLGRWLVDHPGRVLGLTLLATALLVPLLLRLRLDTDIVDLFPRRSPEAQAFARFSRAFAAEQLLVVLVEDSDAARLAAFAERFASALAASPLVAGVEWRLPRSAGEFLRHHLLALLGDEDLDELERRAAPDRLAQQARRIRALLTAPGGSQLIPLYTADPLELLPLLEARLQQGLTADPRTGYFRSRDGRALLLSVRPRRTAYDIEADRALVNQASAAARALGARVTDGRFSGAPGTEVAFTGACAHALYYRDWLHRDMSLSTTVSAACVLLLFALFFRALRAIPLVAAPLLVGLLWTGAAAAALYGRVNAVSLAFGTLLLAIGIDLPIQLYNRLRVELAAHAPAEALTATVRDLFGPALVATLGPALVFFCCALSDYRGLNQLGVLAGVGLLFNFVAMFTVFPALLAMLPPRLWAPAPLKPRQGGWLRRLGQLEARYPRRLLVAALLLAGAAAPAALRVRFEQQLISIQPEAMPPVRAQRELERRFGQRQQALIGLVEQAGKIPAALEPALERADAWLDQAERLRRAGLLEAYRSVSSLLPSARTQERRRARLERIDPAKLERNLRAALAGVGLDPTSFAPFLAQLSQPPAPLTFDDLRAAGLGLLLQAHVAQADGAVRIATYLYPAPGQAAPARAALEQFTREHTAGVLTGPAVLEDVLRSVVVHDTAKVTAASSLLVALLLAAYYRAWRPFVAVMTPLVLAWLLFGAALGLLGLPLNLFNLLSVPLVIGYGIDDHVFLAHRYAARPDPAQMLECTGRAVVLTSLSTMAGFVGLTVARFDGLRMLGLAGALAVALCLLAALLVLPALLKILCSASHRDRR